MRLDFHILWIDDQPKHVASFKEGIERKLSKLGFELNVTQVDKLSDVDKVAADHVHNDGIDLVLVDYDLGAGDGGEQALIAIRKRFPHRELIFYSALEIEKLRKIAFENRIDGVHFATRLTLTDDTLSLIDNILRKVMDLDHMRGVVMSATSDIDWLVEKTLEKLHETLSTEDGAALLGQLTKTTEEKLERYAGELKKAAGKGTLHAILKLKHLVTASDRLEIVIDLMKRASKDSDSTPTDLAVDYRDNVVPNRNKLAHAVVKEVEGKRTLVGAEGSFSEDDMTNLRCELVKHRNNFTNVAVVYDVQLE